ncbi:hypothetical protein CPJCM30710_11040 [Clostridium polyendosporum]|uniref:Uncharacterized protein n=1 Tax=Clostridium polyendosporum TaxID=69208 RepID=A0A919RZG1_9CLOT|nr:hypothetical protein [Clostridium polyendosporum]GIM28438.1 hypothetical protein CPJCM30710_11040 [Clostridium polyendosporum]
MITDAIKYINNRVLQAALGCKFLSKDYKNKIVHVRSLIGKFKKIGNLYKYLGRFNNSYGNTICCD